jgi:hypothetical protein
MEETDFGSIQISSPVRQPEKVLTATFRLAVSGSWGTARADFRTGIARFGWIDEWHLDSARAPAISP